MMNFWCRLEIEHYFQESLHPNHCKESSIIQNTDFCFNEGNPSGLLPLIFYFARNSHGELK